MLNWDLHGQSFDVLGLIRAELEFVSAGKIVPNMIMPKKNTVEGLAEKSIFRATLQLDA